MRYLTPALFSASLIALVLTSCADPLATPAPELSEEATSAEPVEQTADLELPSDEELAIFVESIGSENPSELEAAQDLVLDNSQAAGYLKYFTHNVNAHIDAGLHLSDIFYTVEDLEDGFEVCWPDEPDGECTSYTDFKGEDGLITDFRVAGNDLADRLVIGPGETIAGPRDSELEFVAAYMNANDTHLIVAFDLNPPMSGLVLV